MAQDQLSRIQTEIKSESESERLVGDSKWYIVGLPKHLEPQASFVEDDRAVTGAQLARIQGEVAGESEAERLVGDSKWWIAGLPKHQEPEAGFVEEPSAVTG